VRVAAIPVRHDGALVGVLTREWSPTVGRQPGELERTYLEIFERFARMISDGEFPMADERSSTSAMPRVGDGVMLLDASQRVEYASPNAVSALHRVGVQGNAVGMRLGELGVDDHTVRFAFESGAPATEELEQLPEVVVLVRCLPLLKDHKVSGGVVLVRDISELRRRDRMLLSKDATIREIHHRVKNNLQTVAALLRMQARRSGDPSVQQALHESVRRVASIAMVHETLSTSPDDRVDLDQIVDRLVPMISDVAAAESSARVRRTGTFGILGAELATPLVMVLAEVVQNALQHAFVPESPGGLVTITVERSAKELDIVVADDGIGLPEGFSVENASGLGLQIVRTLIEAELLGSICMGQRSDARGTSVRIVVPLRGRS
jgi:two-component sensor histidine kinase